MACEVNKVRYKVYCETYGCRERAVYGIGNPAVPSKIHNICEKCMKELIRNLPEELLSTQKKGEETPKAYICKYCGEELDSPPKLANHIRYCEARKGE